jgi:hypothetical protein
MVVCREAREHLSRGYGALDALKCSPDVGSARQKLEEVLDEARAAYDLVQQETLRQVASKTKPDCRQWFNQEVRTRAESDDLISWMWRLRGDRHHGAGRDNDPTRSTFTMFARYLNPSDFRRPPGYEQAAFEMSGDGSFWFVKDEGTIRERRQRASATGRTAAARNSFQLGITGPSSHRDRQIPRSVPLDEVLEMGLCWIGSLVEEAEQRWSA